MIVVLIFIVTDSALLAAPKENVPKDGSCKQVAPPPYIEPPQLKSNRQENHTPNFPSYVKQQQHHQHQQQGNNGPRRNLQCYDIRNNKQQNYDNRINYKENQDSEPHHHRSSKILDNDCNPNHDNRQYYPNRDSACPNNGQQFYTLPSYRTTREIEPPRSVTPDITRGLGRGPALSPMHMMARRGHQRCQPSNKFGSDEHLGSKNGNRNIGDHSQHRDQRQTHNNEQTTSVLRNR